MTHLRGAPKIRRMQLVRSAEPASAAPEVGAPRSSRTLAIGVGLALLVFLALSIRFYFACDDAYISYRYSRHLVEGRGLVYNSLESPPVEGYSNFLWVLWVAIAELAGIPPGIFANVTSIACGAALLVLAARMARRRLALHDGATVAVAAFLATLPPFVVWSTGGLETMAFTLFLFLTFERLVGAERPRGVQAGLAALTAGLLRADGAAFALMVLVAASFAWWRPLERAKLRALGVAAAILVAGVALHVAWRWSYYHDLLPNTAYVKAGLSTMRLERGAKYVAAIVSAIPTLALVPLAALFAGPRDSAILRLQCLAVTAGVFFYCFFIGGDWMPFARFFVPCMPFVALLFGAVAGRLSPAPAVGARALAAFAAGCCLLNVLPLFNVHVVPRSIRENFHFRWNDPEVLSERERWERVYNLPHRRLIAETLARHTSETDSLPSIAIGILGYYSEVQLLDQCGLVTPQVARRQTPPVRASPGHDRFVEPMFFLPARPTIGRVWTSTPGAPLETMLERSWVEMIEKGVFVLERHPMPESDPPLELCIMRIPPDSPFLPPKK